MGIVGNLLRNGFYVLFGVASFGAALVLIFTGAVYVLTGHAPNMTRRLVFSLIAVWILLAGYHHHMLPAGSNFSVASFMTYGGMFCGIGGHNTFFSRKYRDDNHFDRFVCHRYFTVNTLVSFKRC